MMRPSVDEVRKAIAELIARAFEGLGAFSEVDRVAWSSDLEEQVIKLEHAAHSQGERAECNLQRYLNPRVELAAAALGGPIGTALSKAPDLVEGFVTMIDMVAGGLEHAARERFEAGK